MLGWRRSGFSPTPSCGTAARTPNGLAANTSSALKNAPKPSRTALAYGATSRSRRRVTKSTRLAHMDSSHSQSSRDPCCDDHAAATRYRNGVVVEECDATTAKEKSERRNAISSIANATDASTATA